MPQLRHRTSVYLRTASVAQ